MSDLVGNPEDRFSHNEAQLCQAVLEKMFGNNVYIHVYSVCPVCEQDRSNNLSFLSPKEIPYET